MIVVSGALVVVALVLLIVGIAVSGLTLVYISIAVSAVSGALLIAGVLLRRGDGRADALAAQGQTLPLSAVPPVGAAPLEPVEDYEPEPVSFSTYVSEPEPVLAATGEPAGLETSEGTVIVVSGRPRYHREGCRFLAGRDDAEAISVEEARESGFTPCGTCKPDEALSAATGAAPLSYAPDPEPAPEPEPLPVAVPVAAAPVTAAKAPARAAKAAKAAKAPAALLPTPAPEATVPPSVPAKAPAKATKAAAAAKAPAAAPAKAAKAAAAAKAPAKAAVAATSPGGPRASVVVIPDRPKFHRSECRFVRDATDTMTLTKGAAEKQGYDACGVCKP